jgi:hypothetical protein
VFGESLNLENGKIWRNLEKFHHPQLEEGSGIPKPNGGNLKYLPLASTTQNVTSTKVTKKSSIKSSNAVGSKGLLIIHIQQSIELLLLTHIH